MSRIHIAGFLFGIRNAKREWFGQNRANCSSSSFLARFLLLRVVFSTENRAKSRNMRNHLRSACRYGKSVYHVDMANELEPNCTGTESCLRSSVIANDWASNSGAKEWDEKKSDPLRRYNAHIGAEISYFSLTAIAIEFTRGLPLAASDDNASLFFASYP